MSSLHLDQFASEFKRAWERRDAEGKAGQRSRLALEEALAEQLNLADGDCVVGEQSNTQCLVLFGGDGMALSIYDNTPTSELRSWFESNPVQRAVAIARLRTVADLLEQAEEDDA